VPHLFIPLPVLFRCLLLALVLTAAVYDLRYRIVPNWLVASGITLALLLNAFEWGVLPGLRTALAGFALALAIYMPLYALHAMGAGDGKLMAAVGAVVGWQDWIGIFLITALIGGITGLIFSKARGRLKRTLWNVGFILAEMKRGRPAYLANEELDVRGSKGLRLPHAAVIAAGTLIYLAIGPFLSA
jgi:prepilin peptidase CpaA